MRTALLPGQWLVFAYEPHLVRDIGVGDELLAANRDRLDLTALIENPQVRSLKFPT